LATVDLTAERLVEELQALRTELGLPDDTDLDTLVTSVRTATSAQVEAFEGTLRWPRHAVDLELSTESRDSPSLPLARFPAVLAASQHIVVLSGPGTGKSTTLVQLARIMLAEGPAPVIVPLAEWAESTDDLFTWVTRRRGFAAISPNQLKLLAEQASLTFLLDGWNEVPGSARRRLILELRGLERDYPLLGLVVTTRRESRDVPLTARQLGLFGLTDQQQFDIAKAMRGDEGVSIVDAAWRTTGLRDLIAIPLYLRALLEAVPRGSGALPETKEQVLRLMVEAHEADSANADLMHRDLMGEQRRYLKEIADVAQQEGTTSLPEGEARAAIGRVNVALAAQGLVSAPPNAQAVLDLLVSGHALTRDPGGTYSFQHQQIQEWFSSYRLQAQIEASGPELTLADPLTIGPLNDPSWGEAVLFACERLSRSGDEGAAAIAAIVRVLLKMDPAFAALVIKRSAAQVWDAVADDVQQFAQAWHTPNQPDLAAAFMISTGRPEFADTIWPLVAGGDDQKQMQAMRLVPRFNPSVLGDRLFRDYPALPEKTRESLAVELAFHGDRAGIDAVHTLALSEPSTLVRRRVLEGLGFRAATSQLEDLLRKSGDELAEEVAQHGNVNDVRDPVLLADLRARQAKHLAEDPSLERRLGRALHELPEEELPGLIGEVLSSPSYLFRENGERVAAEAAARFPQAVGDALFRRIVAQATMPYRPFAYLNAVPPTDDPALEKVLLAERPTEEIAVGAAYMAGPGIVTQLVERYLNAVSRYKAEGVRTEVAYAQVRAVTDLINNVRPGVLFQVLLAYATGADEEQIDALSDVISRAGPPRENDEPLRLTEAERAAAVELLNGWARQLLENQGSLHTLGELASAMRRLPDNSQVPVLEDMLDADLRAIRAARAAFNADRRNVAALREAQHSHKGEYCRCLARIGTPDAEKVLRDRLMDEEVGLDAAIGLQVIWIERNQPLGERRFQLRPDFERAVANRKRDRTISCESADAILAASGAALADGTPRGLGRALKFAGAAVLLPHGEQSANFAALLAREGDIGARLDFAQRMVVGGLVVPSDVILALLNAFLEELGERKWLSENEASQVIDWLELLPFSDRPASILDGLSSVAAKELGHWRLPDVLRSVGFVPEPERSDLLRGIIQKTPELTGEYGLYQAIGSPSGPALELVLDIAAGRLGSGSMERGVRFDYPAQVWHGLSQAERESLLSRFGAATVAKEKSFIAEVLLAGGDHNAFLSLAADPIGQAAIKRQGWVARQSLLYVQHPLGADSSSYELVPRDISRLREGLFDLSLSTDGSIAAFALRYLQEVELTRVEEGGNFTGPRHPHISTGAPWPAVAVQRSAGVV